jgi:hypothetical protein
VANFIAFAKGTSPMIQKIVYFLICVRVAIMSDMFGRMPAHLRDRTAEVVADDVSSDPMLAPMFANGTNLLFSSDPLLAHDEHLPSDRNARRRENYAAIKAGQGPVRLVGAPVKKGLPDPLLRQNARRRELASEKKAIEVAKQEVIDGGLTPAALTKFQNTTQGT